MGVNMAGFCITDDEVCREASKREINRRFFLTRCALRQGGAEPAEVSKIELLMNKIGISSTDRPVVGAALQRAEKTGGPAVAIELSDGRIITGKTTALLGASAALLLNALKELAGIKHDIPLISPIVIEPIQDLKINHMGNQNPRLHTDEILIALAICAATNPMAALAIDQLEKLRGCDAHATTILSHVDENIFMKLGVSLTSEPEYQTKRLYHP
jgi:uncharacterized protein (UPF0371 family)